MYGEHLAGGFICMCVGVSLYLVLYEDVDVYDKNEEGFL